MIGEVEESVVGSVAESEGEASVGCHCPACPAVGSGYPAPAASKLDSGTRLEAAPLPDEPDSGTPAERALCPFAGVIFGAVVGRFLRDGDVMRMALPNRGR